MLTEQVRIDFEDPERCCRTGKRWRCKNKAAAPGGYCDACLESRRNRPEDHGTVVGVARSLRSRHGYERGDSLVVAAKLFDETIACAICALPGVVLFELWRRRGPFFVGPFRNNTRFTADRVDVTRPHTARNTRITCWSCNSTRNESKLSDADVRSKVLGWWHSSSPLDLRWWLSPGTAPASVILESW